MIIKTSKIIQEIWHDNAKPDDGGENENGEEIARIVRKHLGTDFTMSASGFGGDEGGGTLLVGTTTTILLLGGKEQRESRKVQVEHIDIRNEA